MLPNDITTSYFKDEEVFGGWPLTDIAIAAYKKNKIVYFKSVKIFRL
jgi:hypothetical protein